MNSELEKRWERSVKDANKKKMMRFTVSLEEDQIKKLRKIICLQGTQEYTKIKSLSALMRQIVDDYIKEYEKKDCIRKKN